MGPFHLPVSHNVKQHVAQADTSQAEHRRLIKQNATAEQQPRHKYVSAVIILCYSRFYSSKK